MNKVLLTTPVMSLSYSDIQPCLSKGEHWRHPFTRLLLEKGTEIQEERFTSEQDSMFLGLKFIRGISEIVYRFIRQDFILVVFFRKMKRGCGLRSSFRDFIWFMDMVAKERSCIKRIIGKVRRLRQVGYGDMSTERMVRFYVTYLNACICEIKGEPFSFQGKPKGVWLYLDLKNYNPTGGNR